MKKYILAVAVLLVLSLLAGCVTQQEDPTTPGTSVAPTEPSTLPSTEPDPTEPSTLPATEPDPTEPSTLPATEPDPTEPSTLPPTEPDPTDPNSVEAAYAQQIGRYYEAISNQWDEDAYFNHEMSAMVAHYYEGNALENVGYAFLDLNGDEVQELIIGAIMNARHFPLVFEIWTLHHGEPVMLAQSGSANRYFIQYAEEDELWSVAYEAENGAANFAYYDLQLTEGALEVVQGVVFNAMANENDPWFMTYDLDWDVSNDVSIDADTANAIMEAGKNIYKAIDYLPLRQYK